MAKAPSKSKAVAAPKQGGALVNWRDRAAQSIEKNRKTAAQLPGGGGGNFISFKGGSITLGNESMKNPLPAIVLASQYERNYYANDYQPGVAATPDCYSYDGKTPHEKASDPAADECEHCPLNQFGSARNGKGKACKEGVKLALLSPDTDDSPILQGRLSVTNTKYWSSYVNALDVAPWQMITLIKNQPDPKNQYRVSFTAHADVPEDALNAIAAKVDEAEKLLETPYPEIGEQSSPQQQSKARVGGRDAAGNKRRSKFT